MQLDITIEPTFKISTHNTGPKNADRQQKGRQTEGSAYEPTVQLAHVGLEKRTGGRKCICKNTHPPYHQELLHCKSDTVPFSVSMQRLNSVLCTGLNENFQSFPKCPVIKSIFRELVVEIYEIGKVQKKKRALYCQNRLLRHTID